MNKTLLCGAFALATIEFACAQQFAVIELGTPTIQAAVTAVNNAGVAVGWDLDLDALFLAVRWTGSAPATYAPLGVQNQAHATAVSDAGDAAAILFTLGSLPATAMLVGATGSASLVGGFEPRGMNDAGVIVGKRDVTLPTGWHTQEAVRYENGVLAPLGSPGDDSSEASDVNNLGVAVGSFIPAGQMRPRACAWIGTQKFDLGTLPGGVSAQAVAISDAGYVVGVSDGPGGVRHAFRLTLSSTGVVTNRIDLGDLGHGFFSRAR